MSTTAESAQKWLNEKSPSLDEVKSVLVKLEDRIENWEGEVEGIQGSIDAACLLQAYLDASSAKTETPPTAISASLDTEALIPDHQPVELEENIKQETFAALKAQLGKSLK